MYKHFMFQQHGTITQIHALTAQAWDWLKENVYFESWQVFDKSIAVEPCNFGEIFIKIKKEFQ